MRLLLILLVFGNLLAFIVAGGWLGASHSVPGDDAAHQPLSPDRIRLVSRGEPPVVVSPAVPVKEEVVCYDWSGLTAEQVKAGRAAAEGRGLTITVKEQAVSKSEWWLHVPPMSGGKVAAEKKVNEFKSLGVKSARVEAVEEGARFAVTLGVFATEAEASKVLAGLRQKGVRSAVLSERALGEATEAWSVRGTAGALEALGQALGTSPAIACEVAATAVPVVVPAAAVAQNPKP